MPEINEATVISIIPYADGPEVNVETVYSADELDDVLIRIRDPKVAEYVVDVDVEVEYE